jgi:hypothetical protein
MISSAAKRTDRETKTKPKTKTKTKNENENENETRFSFSFVVFVPDAQIYCTVMVPLMLAQPCGEQQ